MKNIVTERKNTENKTSKIAYLLGDGWTEKNAFWDVASKQYLKKL